MNGALVVLLAMLWAFILLPGIVRSRRGSPASSVGTFERAMDVLARQEGLPRRANGRYIYVPHDPERLLGAGMTRHRQAVIARRRRVFTRLLSATGVSFVAAVAMGGLAWMLFAGVSAGLAVYVGLLRRWKWQADEAADVAHAIPVAAESPAPPRLVAAGGNNLGGAVQVATRADEPWHPRTGVRIRRWED